MGLRRVKNLTIDRSKWNRGGAIEAKRRGLEKSGRGLLDPKTGGMCCLGFLTKACGASVKHEDYDTQGHLACYPPDEIKELYGLDEYGVSAWSPFISLNDDNNPVCSKEREEKLTALFKEKLNIDVNFVGETPRHPSHR